MSVDSVGYANQAVYDKGVSEIDYKMIAICILLIDGTVANRHDTCPTTCEALGKADEFFGYLAVPGSQEGLGGRDLKAVFSGEPADTQRGKEGAGVEGW
jgi:hypothetical protein